MRSLRALSWSWIAVAACAQGGAIAPAEAPAQPAKAAAVRLFHSPSDADFWVERARDRGLVTASGVRLEVARSGEIVTAAWEVDLARQTEMPSGGLVVPERQGGGFVHWSRGRVFRSTSFTGALSSIGVDRTDDPPKPQRDAIRGARAGRSSILVFRETGPRELLPGAAILGAIGTPGVLDEAALASGRAARLDVLGRVSVSDGGARFDEVKGAPSASSLSVGEEELAIHTPRERTPLLAGGKLGEPRVRAIPEPARRFQVAWREGADRVEPPWGSQGSPLAAAIGGGGDAGDGTAFAALQGVVVRVDLATGSVLSTAHEQAASGLTCQPVRAPDALLFACTWDRFQGLGGYVLRSERGAPPVIERAFSDEGSYAQNDDGVLGFVGSCASEPRSFDPDDPSRQTENPGEAPLSPVFCVRRGPGDWVERRVDLDEGATLLAWVAGSDGRAAALVASSDPLPGPGSPAGRVTDRGGVRIVEVDRAAGGFTMPRMGAPGDGAAIERRLHLRDDGSIDLWLTPAQDAWLGVAAATLDPRGELTLHAAAPGMTASIGAGRFGLSIAANGDLYETVDHGRSHRFAGPSPVPPSALSSAACSALGCAIGPVVRVGWGAPAITPRVSLETPPEPPLAPAQRRLTCAPKGLPSPMDPPAPKGSGEARAPWGEKIALVSGPKASPHAPPARPSRRGKPTPPPPVKPSPAVTQTLALLARQPFTTRAPRRVDATDVPLTPQPRAPITALLAPRGEVQMLVTGNAREMILAGDRPRVLPVFERRGGGDEVLHPAGLATEAGGALLLADLKRRLAIVEHGPAGRAAPWLIGVEPDPRRERPLTLARRDDGAIALLALDGPAPDTIGAAILDRSAAALGPFTALAPWSTALDATDPACAREVDGGAFEALIVVDPAAWLTLDEASLPGLALASQGLIHVRWGRERACLLGLEAALVDRATRGKGGRSFQLVARWTGHREAAVLADDLRQDLTCRLAR